MKLRLNDKKFQTGVIRFLMLDNQQTTFNKIIQALELQSYTIQGKLLDDLNNFEKLLNLQWDVIIYQSAYDLSFEQALELIDKKGKSIPVILLNQQDPQSIEAIRTYNSGIFDIVSPHNLNYLNFSLIRAARFSRLLNKAHRLSLDIDKLQQQTQTLVESTEHAVAIFLEGVHVSVNEQYAQLFSSSGPEEFIGLPLLDIIQPSDTTAFKQHFKRLSKGDFNQASFKVKTLNPDAKQHTLLLQFSATNVDGESGLQLVIATETIQPSVPDTIIQYIEPSSTYASKNDISALIHQTLQHASYAGLILFVLDQLPDQVLNDDWQSSSIYLNEFHSLLNSSINQSILKISDTVFITSNALNNENAIHDLLNNYLNKIPKQINIHGKTYSVNAHLSYQVLTQKTDIENIDQLLSETFAQRFDLTSTITLAPLDLPVENFTSIANEISIPDEPTFSFGEVIVSTIAPSAHLTDHESFSDTERHLEEKIESNDINLHFQQLYDKEDIDTHIYEVTASFKHHDQIIQLEDFPALRLNSDLAIKTDRWILVEASKRLHQFLTKCPKARVVVNLHAASMDDADILSLLSKLVNLINSKYTKPLILQFQEEDITTNFGVAAKFIQSVQDYGVGVTISNFGQSDYGLQILQQFNLAYVKLHTQFTQQLNSDDSMVELQEKLDIYKEHSNEVKFLLSGLDDMTFFANAWNVNVRYLQGQYFQAQQLEFIDSAS